MLTCPTCTCDMALIAPGHWRCPVCSSPEWMNRLVDDLRDYSKNLRRVAVLHEQLESLTAVAATRTEGGGSRQGVSDPTGSRASQAADWEEELIRRQGEIDVIAAALATLPETEREIVTRQHVNGEQPHDICDRLHISRRWYYQLRRRALEQLAQVLGMEV